MQENANGAMRNTQPDSVESGADVETAAAQSPQRRGSGATAVVTPPVARTELEELRQELGKWQERVPKLAGALRERTQERDALKAQLDQARGTSAATESASGIKARDLLITELEAKLKAQSSRHQDAQGQLHARDVEIAELKEELSDWRNKWQNATENLDVQSERLSSKDTDLLAAREELELLRHHNHELERRLKAADLETTALKENARSLEARHAKLFETTEMANRQIESLGDSLSGLREQTKSAAAELDTKSQQLTDLEVQLANREEKLAATRSELEDATAGLEKAATMETAQSAEIRHLQECVAQAEQANDSREIERRQLSEQMTELQNRNSHLETQLEERSSLVMGLEEEKSVISSEAEAMLAENRRLSAALEQAQRHAAEDAEHIAHVDARLERQQNLMANLEKEFAEAQQESSDVRKAHTRALQQKQGELLSLKEKYQRDSAESGQLESVREAAAVQLAEAHHEIVAAQSEAQEKIAELEKQLRKQSQENASSEGRLVSLRAKLETLEQREKGQSASGDSQLRDENELLQAEVQKLEGMVRDRTEQLNQVRWRQQMAEQEQTDGESGDKMLVVLNQQLSAAREDNQRLLAQIASMEAQGAGEAGDDLSRIRGIGPKLVAQLAEYDITTFAQIAELHSDDLNQDDHPLHPLRGRIAKDEWIAQAQELTAQ